MKGILTFLAILCFIVFALPAFADIDENYGRKVLELDENSVTSLDASVGGEIPSDEWLYENGLYFLVRYQLDPIWSPDGKWIACTQSFQHAGLWLLPVDGGDPVLLYNNKWIFEGYYIGCGHIIVCGFTPDGEEIIISTQVIDESRGTVVTLKFNDNGSYRGCSVSGSRSDLLAVNVKTGEARELVRESYYGICSHDGSLLAYIQNDGSSGKKLSILNINTNETWNLDISTSDFCFSHDDADIIYADDVEYSDSLTTQLFRIPVTGDTPEQITFPTGDEITYRHLYPECSPDGEWILFSGNGGPRANTISDATGSHSYSTPAISKLCAFNVYTQETIEFFPREPAIASCQPSFSLDGTQFCYQYENKDQRHQSISICIKDFDLASQKQSIQVAVETNTPSGFELYGNYPNPFNPTTTIEFSLPEAGFTDLFIYNMAGQKVRELVSQTMAGGVHSVVWDGRDESGLAVSAGVYLTRLRMDENVRTGNMMLVK